MRGRHSSGPHNSAEIKSIPSQSRRERLGKLADRAGYNGRYQNLENSRDPFKYPPKIRALLKLNFQFDTVTLFCKTSATSSTLKFTEATATERRKKRPRVSENCREEKFFERGTKLEGEREAEVECSMFFLFSPFCG